MFGEWIPLVHHCWLQSRTECTWIPWAVLALCCKGHLPPPFSSSSSSSSPCCNLSFSLSDSDAWDIRHQLENQCSTWENTHLVPPLNCHHWVLQSACIHCATKWMSIHVYTHVVGITPYGEPECLNGHSLAETAHPRPSVPSERLACNSILLMDSQEGVGHVDMAPFPAVALRGFYLCLPRTPP